MTARGVVTHIGKGLSKACDPFSLKKGIPEIQKGRPPNLKMTRPCSVNVLSFFFAGLTEKADNFG